MSAAEPPAQTPRRSRTAARNEQRAAQPPPQAPRAWRAYGALTGLFATGAALAAMLLPWFERRDPAGRAHTYTPWLWGASDAAAPPEMPLLSLQIAELVWRREWGLSFVIAAASAALISFIAAAGRPPDRRAARATVMNVIAAAIAVILIVLMALAFAGDGPAGASTAPRLGFFVGVAAVAGWLWAGIAFARVGAAARATPSTT